MSRSLEEVVSTLRRTGMKDAADEKGVAMSKDESREIVYGMPYEQWRAKHQQESTPAQKAAFEKASQKH